MVWITRNASINFEYAAGHGAIGMADLTKRPELRTSCREHFYDLLPSILSI
jgi:hypothetical protein